MPLYSDQHIIDQKFRESLSDYSVKPSSRSWWRISQSLSFPPKSSARKIIIITSTLLLMASSAGLLETIHHSNASSKKALANESTITRTPLMASASETSFGNSAVKHSSKRKEITSNSLKQYPANENIIQAFSTEDNSNTQREVVSFSLMNIADVTALSTKEHVPPSVNTVGVNPPGKLGIGSCYIGVAASFNSTWLVDAQALKSENLKYQFTAGASYGMQGGYYFAKRWGLQAAWILNSWEGQHYKNIDLYGRTTSLDYTEKSISLSYMQIPLLVQYRVPKYSEVFKNAYNIDLVFGGQYGRLLSYRVDAIKGEIGNNQLFNKNEFAAVVGFDYDFMTDNTVFYTLGIRTSLGSNIFNSNVPNYFEFDEPHNFVIGLHAAVNFGFIK